MSRMNRSPHDSYPSRDNDEFPPGSGYNNRRPSTSSRPQQGRSTSDLRQGRAPFPDSYVPVAGQSYPSTLGGQYGVSHPQPYPSQHQETVEFPHGRPPTQGQSPQPPPSFLPPPGPPPMQGPTPHSPTGLPPSSHYPSPSTPYPPYPSGGPNYSDYSIPTSERHGVPGEVMHQSQGIPHDPSRTGVATCRFPNCSRPVTIDKGTGEPSEYCSRDHMLGDIQRGVSVCLSCEKCPRRRNSKYCGLSCERYEAQKLQSQGWPRSRSGTASSSVAQTGPQVSPPGAPIWAGAPQNRTPSTSNPQAGHHFSGSSWPAPAEELVRCPNCHATYTPSLPRGRSEHREAGAVFNRPLPPCPRCGHVGSQQPQQQNWDHPISAEFSAAQMGSPTLVLPSASADWVSSSGRTPSVNKPDYGPSHSAPGGGRVSSCPRCGGMYSPWGSCPHCGFRGS
ncbi:hypothetical protein F5148DRAFT_772443 [Russula earlei]|uniref:Uncharacterized protein n=1 Tax=Russula earlei TaxID=71964 RepID=A0ACC0UE05_9AGAM|nr:hypothetical protein F5148DRAFT_772443 [Russula earlei]